MGDSNNNNHKMRSLLVDLMGEIFTFSFGIFVIGVGCLTGILIHYGIIHFSPSRLFTINPRQVIHEIASNPAVADVLDFPDHVYGVVRTFANVTHADSSYIDLIEKYIEINNFTVTPVVEGIMMEEEQKEEEEEEILQEDSFVPTERNDNKRKLNILQSPPPALSIGKLRLEWDTYDHPCYKIYVKDVCYTFEFTKHPPFLHSNWDELKEQGFPPPPPPEEEQTKNKKKKGRNNSNAEEPPFTIGSLHLEGYVTLKVISRPFQKEVLKSIDFDMNSLKDLFELIDKKAGSCSNKNNNKQTQRRRGLTPDELGKLIEDYFKQQIIAKLKATTSFFKPNWPAMRGDGGGTGIFLVDPPLEHICPLVKDQSVPWIKGIGGGGSGVGMSSGNAKANNIMDAVTSRKQKTPPPPDYVPTVNWFGGNGVSTEKRKTH